MDKAAQGVVTVAVSAAPAPGRDPAPSGDFTLSSNNVLTFAEGSTTSTGTVTISSVDNNADQATRKWVRVTGAVTGNAVMAGGQKSAWWRFSIDDDDPQPFPTVVLTPATISENGGVSAVTVMLSNPTLRGNLVLDVRVPGGRPQGFQRATTALRRHIKLSTNTRLTIAAGMTASTGIVTITGVDQQNVTVTRHLPVRVHNTGTVPWDVNRQGPPGGDERLRTGYSDRSHYHLLALTPYNPPPPTAQITMPAKFGSAERFIVAGFLFSEAVTGFDTNDITVTGATKVQFSEEEVEGFPEYTGRLYVLRMMPEGDKDVTVRVAKDAATNMDGTAGPPAPVSKTARWEEPDDNDDPPPDTPTVSLSVSASRITEGASALTLTATRSAANASGAALTIPIRVKTAGTTAQGNDYTLGAASISIPLGATTGTTTFAVTDDSADEPAETVVIELHTPPAGTALGTPSEVTITIDDNDDPPPDTPTVTITAGAAITEGGAARFTVARTGATTTALTVLLSVSDAAGSDFVVGSEEGEKQVVIPTGSASVPYAVATTADDVDEPDGAVTLALRDSSAYVTGTPSSGAVDVSDDDAAPLTRVAQAWLARFGRTVAVQALDGVAGRMSASRAPGLTGRLGGQSLAFAPPASGEGWSRGMDAREFLLGSSFALTGEEDASGGSLAFWGRAGHGRFEGKDGGLVLDGAVTSGMLGADYAKGNWLIGLALSHSVGEGDYAEDVVSGGAVESTLTAAIPYAAFRISERLTLWGAAGYGAGKVTLSPTGGGALTADTRWAMAAASLRGVVLAPPTDRGPALSVIVDALWTRTTSEEKAVLDATEADVTRLRLGLEGGWRFALGSGGELTPTLVLGARHDGGDAETGLGLEVGGGLKWVAPVPGLSLDVSGRTLLVHEDDGLRDVGVSGALAFDPDATTARGPSLSLRQTFGGQATGGLDALFAPDPLEDRTGPDATARWAMQAAYGFPAFGGRFTGSPHLGLALAPGTRDYSLGWRLTPEGPTAPAISLDLKATRRETTTARPEHTIGLQLQTTW
ncbi:MAG: autotransporter outer membrane beta-barrel domain-containing protein [Acidimicrobiaceae bacterium]|nr:autotransporter outer membrane beta-barrel domain-containing protein [Acidimicrobiaceae bacterium]